jgi:hypothetical protein
MHPTPSSHSFASCFPALPSVHCGSPIRVNPFRSMFFRKGERDVVAHSMLIMNPAGMPACDRVERPTEREMTRNASLSMDRTSWWSRTTATALNLSSTSALARHTLCTPGAHTPDTHFALRTPHTQPCLRTQISSLSCLFVGAWPKSDHASGFASQVRSRLRAKLGATGGLRRSLPSFG